MQPLFTNYLYNYEFYLQEYECMLIRGIKKPPHFQCGGAVLGLFVEDAANMRYNLSAYSFLGFYC